MPNQEHFINRSSRVTYHDNARNMRIILLPNRELLQAYFLAAAAISFGEQGKQERESLVIQRGTKRENGWRRSPLGTALWSAVIQFGTAEPLHRTR